MKKTTPWLHLFGVPLVALAALSVPGQRVAALCPTIISHAAAKKIAPENTVAGIHAARQVQGVDIVEVDQRYTKSNYPYLLHDETLDRTTTGTGKLSDTWVSQMATVSAADFTPWNTNPLYTGNLPNGKPKVEVPFVYDYLKAAKDENLKLLIDAKVTPTADQAAIFMGYVIRNDIQMQSNIMYMGSFDHVKQMRAWYSNLTYGVIEYPPTGRVYSANYLASNGVSFYALPIDATALTESFVNYMHSWGIQVATWTSDTEQKDVYSNWQLAADMGIDYLITNNPLEARMEVTQCQVGSSSPASSSSAQI